MEIQPGGRTPGSSQAAAPTCLQLSVSPRRAGRASRRPGDPEDCPGPSPQGADAHREQVRPRPGGSPSRAWRNHRSPHSEVQGGAAKTAPAPSPAPAPLCSNKVLVSLGSRAPGSAGPLQGDARAKRHRSQGWEGRRQPQGLTALGGHLLYSPPKFLGTAHCHWPTEPGQLPVASLGPCRG